MVTSRIKTDNAQERLGTRVFPQQGFTLVELMIVVVLVSGLLGIGVPSFRDFILNQRAKSAGTDIVIAMMTARSEAVKRNRTVELKAHPDGWGAGWSIPSPTPGEPDILSHVQSGNIAILGPASPAKVEFSASGRTLGAADFEIDAGAESGNLCRSVRLGLDGRTSFKKEECSHAGA